MTDDSLKPLAKVTLREAVAFVLTNFSAPIIFFLVFQKYGAKPAIFFAVASSLLQFAYHRWKMLRPSPFFIVASGFTIAFGAIDLVAESPRFFRLQPFAENFLLGAVFLGSVLTGRPALRWFVEGLPPALQPKMPEGLGPYLERVTLVWSAYFFLKSFLFLYLAFHVDLGRLVILRSLIGGGTLVLMVGGEILYRRGRRY